MTGILTVLFCMLIGCEKKAGKEELVLISLEEEAGDEETDRGLDSEQTVSQQTESLENSLALSEKMKTEEILVIHLCGAVAEPGVYLLPKNSRLYQAVEEAGGLLEDAGVEYINLADLLADGEKIYIPTIQEAEEAGMAKEESRAGQTKKQSEENQNPFAETVTGSVSDGKININTASAELLCTLPGVGSGKAEKIIAYREAYGEFKTTEDIMKVAGIKDKVFQKIKDLIVV